MCLSMEEYSEDTKKNFEDDLDFQSWQTSWHIYFVNFRTSMINNFTQRNIYLRHIPNIYKFMSTN